MSKMGRPPRAGKVADIHVAVRVTSTEFRDWTRAAMAAGSPSLSAWLRHVATQAAQRPK